jgi:hypothetical protein
MRERGWMWFGGLAAATIAARFILAESHGGQE